MLQLDGSHNTYVNTTGVANTWSTHWTAPDMSTQSQVEETQTISGDSAAPKKFSCQSAGCFSSFDVKKDLLRHEKGHQKPGPNEPLRRGFYECRCCYVTARKGDLIRHLNADMERCERSEKHFTCRCGKEFPCNALDEFRKEISKCGVKQPGRPRRS
ncbi:hypothetical protein F5884DRAFT_754179 [Xylogone sp. PMI_703]|nr:hypothetical protein F5884DRAFT_754179 [Xylogone sp. PMI_703]